MQDGTYHTVLSTILDILGTLVETYRDFQLAVPVERTFSPIFQIQSHQYEPTWGHQGLLVVFSWNLYV